MHAGSPLRAAALRGLNFSGGTTPVRLLGVRLEQAAARPASSAGGNQLPASFSGRCAAGIVGGPGRSARVNAAFTCRIATL